MALAGTTWTFDWDTGGKISFSTAGPSVHNGPANISWTSPSFGQVSGVWGESVYGLNPTVVHFVVQYILGPGIAAPPPLNIEPANPGPGMPGPYICLWGSCGHTNKVITGFASNFNNAPAGQQHVIVPFQMTLVVK